MRAFVVMGLLLTLFLHAGTAQAEGLDNLKAGINSLATFPADPFIMVWTVNDNFEDVPLAPVTGRILGLGAGTLLSVHRLAMGTFDVVLSPLYFFPVMSPEPRWAIFEDLEYE